MTKLTAKKVENASPREKEYKLHDGGGLFLRIRPSGAKSWLFSFSLPKDRKLIRMTLGSVKDISLKEARAKLPELHDQISQGIDPRYARAAKQTENVSAITMQKLFNNWIEFIKLENVITCSRIKRHEDRWRLHLRKKLGYLLAKDVTRTHLANALATMARKGIKEETRKALTTLNLMLDYGLTRHSMEHNPARTLKSKDFTATTHSRNRRLNVHQTNTRFLMLSPSHTLTGKYIKLEPLTEAHRNTLKNLSQDERISTYSPALKLKFNAWFDKALKSLPESRQMAFVVRTINEDKIVGSTRFYEMYPEHKRLTIGYTWYIPEVWGSFVNIECKLLLLRYAFETLQINRIEFFIDSRNERSRAAVKKLGATEEGSLRQHTILENEFIRDTVVYSILKQEWPEVLVNLEERLNSKC